MQIKITGARQHNLKQVDVELGDGLTVVTGVSGPGKSSLIVDTLYHEAHRHFIELFAASRTPTRVPAEVESIAGLSPASAVISNTIADQKSIGRILLGKIQVAALDSHLNIYSGFLQR